MTTGWGPVKAAISTVSALCKGIGRRLFQGVSQEEAKAVHEARYEAWLCTLRARKYIEEHQVNEEAEAEEIGSKNQWWYNGVVGAEDEKHSDFALTRVWKEYKLYLSKCYTGPFDQGPSI